MKGDMDDPEKPRENSNITTQRERFQGDEEMTENIERIMAVLVIAILCFAATANQANAAGHLEIVLYTNSQYYMLGSNVAIYGYLFNDSNRVGDGIINLQVDYPNGTWQAVFRTLSTGTMPAQPPAFQILCLYPCNQSGGPKNSFRRGEFAYFNVTFRNNNSTKIDYYTTLTCFDSTNSVMDSNYFSGSLNAYTVDSWLIPFSINEKASIGRAIVYANIFDKLPKNGGTALALEASATFNVTGTTGLMTPPSQGLTQQAQTPGTFMTNFTIPKFQYQGNYTIYTTSRYKGLFTSAQKWIMMRTADVNLDNRVNVLDLIIVASNIGKTGPPGWISSDLNRDGKVNVLDLIIVATWIGWVSP